MAMKGNNLRKGEFEDDSGKRHNKCEQAVQDESLTMQRTDKEHEE